MIQSCQHWLYRRLIQNILIWAHKFYNLPHFGNIRARTSLDVNLNLRESKIHDNWVCVRFLKICNKTGKTLPVHENKSDSGILAKFLALMTCNLLISLIGKEHCLIPGCKYWQLWMVNFLPVIYLFLIISPFNHILFVISTSCFTKL